jgi:hypothetical protein
VIPLGVTVSARGGARFRTLAQAKAREWELPFVPREPSGGIEVLLEHAAEALLIVGGTGWVLRDRAGELGFGPGMAKVRIKRFESLVHLQQPDHLVQYGELKPGDHVIDATLGLAVDALVCAHAVGVKGRVEGFEASRPLFLLASEGLARLKPFAPMCRVEPWFGRASELLAERATGSADVVLLDPMFDLPKKSSGAFETLRRHAVHEPLDEATLAEARRVARRWVLVKAGAWGREFRRLGLTAEPRSRSAPVQWARVPGSG